MSELRKFSELSEWHQNLLHRLLDADFPGRPQLVDQLTSAEFRVVDNNGSLSISPTNKIPAADLKKRIPVEAYADDCDEIPVHALLFTSQGFAYLLELLRGDGNPIKRMPPVDSFEIMVLAP